MKAPRYLAPFFLFSLAHAFAFRFLFSTGNALFFYQADQAFRGLAPYRDYVFEYPPLALAVILPPRLFGDTPALYGRALSYEMLLIDVGVLALIAMLCRDRASSPWGPLAAYSAALLALGSLPAQRYDLFPALLVIAALFSFSRGRLALCWALLALGTMAKAYPALLAPFLLALHLAGRDYAGLLRGAGAAAATIAAFAVPALALSPEGFLGFLQYHSSRGVQLESIYASLLLIGHKLGLTQAGIVFRYGANDVVSPFADRLAGLSAFLVAATLLAAYAAYVIRRLAAQANISSAAGVQLMAACWGLAVAALLATGKVLSPQFLIWLIPLVAVTEQGRRPALWIIMLAAASALTWYVYPAHYYDLFDFQWHAISALALRNLLLLAIGAMLLGAVLCNEGRKEADA